MVTVQEVITLAQNGELKQLAIKDDIEAVVGFINLGLLELYKRFPIETKEFLITLIDGVEEYQLPDDFMWIVTAYGEVTIDSYTSSVNTLPVNSPDDPLSINTISWNKVQIPSAVGGEVVSIIYTASPQKASSLALNDPLPIPDQMTEALLNYIGYRGHGSVDGKINTESNTHYQRFELSVNRIQKDGMFTFDSSDMATRIQDKGFV